ncbi:MAG: ABC transporter substrate binding protein [Pseudomonadota bacterium]|nr:ABC transporter substrate binding protein [Pseudomonadota bacterium]
MSRRLFFLFLIWLAFRPAWAEGVIHLILSDQGGAYQEVTEAFRAGVGQRQAIKVWSLPDLTASQVQSMTRTSDLVAPVGVKAARFVAEHHAGQAAVLSLMIPRAVSEKLQWPASLGRKKVSAVYIDQPPSRSLGLVEAAFPAARRVGVLISADNAGVAKLLMQESARRNLKLHVESVDSADDVAPALRRVLPDSDVLLLVPDAIAINAGNAQNVLLTTYRFRVPVLGFSQGLSKAGAVASVYSSPAQIGRQGASMAVRLAADDEMPLPQHAAEFFIAFNPHVARSLGVVLPNEDEIRRKLGAQSE